MPLTFSRVVRRTHMYLALFLTPWMIIYALSGLVLNHNQAVRALYGTRFGQFEKVQERPYEAVFSEDTPPQLIATHILDDLGLGGPFNVQTRATDSNLIINRNSAFAQYRITYFREGRRLLVEKQAFSAPAFVNRSHFRRGYEQPFVSSKIWAFTVDAVIVGMIFWVLSGLIMWWEIKPARLAGAAFAVAGVGLFALLFATI